ncbi:hypothetical protein K431DRAFT_288575 [Polychaeton citri CBS 116435]|uniref:Uncharacterized protein n=1 Tax=Polychaeton citri CBS 116435 TaxID=1314669 RepID=A0A9P4ULW2_9PEZI|nr:hypothetical protein K431DRAFT_288575 [Polychaeton citri CBS 116435]
MNNTQEQIPHNGAIVVLLIITSDLIAHAVYLTISNLLAHIRNSNHWPRTILLAMLLIVKEGDRSLLLFDLKQTRTISREVMQDIINKRFASILTYSNLRIFKHLSAPYRVLRRSSRDSHFNFPKFYAIVHYTDIIRLLGNAIDLETRHFKHKHVEFGQIMEHHCRKLNMQAYFDISFLARLITIAERRELAERLIELTSAPRKTTKGPRQSRDNSPISTHFRQALAVFSRYNPNVLEEDDSWVYGLRIKFHASMHRSITQMALDGRLPAQVRFIITLYCLKRANGLANKAHSMTIILLIPLALLGGQLRRQRFYPLVSVYYSIYVVLVSNNATRDMYINNTANFETYNML